MTRAMIVDIASAYSFHQLGERANQEDSRYPDTDTLDIHTPVYVVCDGVGGSDKGEVASSTVCKSIGEFLMSHKNTDRFTDEDFSEVLQYAYSGLNKVSDATNRGMGTTMTFLLFHTGGALAAHIGDSRIYQIRPNEGIMYRSEDHSLVNALLRSGNITPEEVKNHPQSNIITRCMSADDGTRQQDDATVVNLRDIAPDDYFLLCTDGVTGMVEDEELIELYSSDKTDEEKRDILAEKCRSSSDNNTAIQIRVGMVTVDVEPETEEETSESDQSRVETQKIPNKDDSVHELSARTEKQSKIISFIKNLFK